MSQEWLFLFAGIVGVSFATVLCVAVFWLRGVKKTVFGSLSDIVGHQVRTAQRMSEAIDELQKQQDVLARQVHSLTMEEVRLRRELSSVSTRLDTEKTESPLRQTLH